MRDAEGSEAIRPLLANRDDTDCFVPPRLLTIPGLIYSTLDKVFRLLYIYEAFCSRRFTARALREGVKLKLVIGITGASGVIYGIRLLQVLSINKDVETHLIVSEAAEKNVLYETNWRVKDIKALATKVYDVADIGAAPSSGSFKRDGMVVIPCSIKTMSALANSYNENLVIRSGDVTLKERKPLVLVVRETPLHAGHLESLLKLSRMGAVIMPPVPAFYHRPKKLEDIVDHTVGHVLDVFDIEHKLFKRWSGIPTD